MLKRYILNLIFKSYYHSSFLTHSHSLFNLRLFSTVVPNGNSFRVGSDYNNAYLNNKIYEKNSFFSF